MAHELDVSWVRAQFPALARPAVFFDGPAGSQVPRSVADAVSAYLLETNANSHGAFPTSAESDAIALEARRAARDLVGASDEKEIVFGPNMTSLTFAMSRTLARTWKSGDEVVLTRLDHDANVTPWVRTGFTVKMADVRLEDATLDLASLKAAIGPKTRIVAVTAASNGVGSLTPLAEIAEMTHAVGAELYVDAVHYAPHARIDVAAWNCDFLACSAYKFFGPHVGILWGRAERMAGLPVDKVRPSDESIPARFETGTPAYEGIAGVRAAIEYLASIGKKVAPGTADRRAALDAAYRAIVAHERKLLERLMAGLAELPSVRVWGITDPARFDERCPTISFTHARLPARTVAGALAEHGIYAWDGNFYALELSRALGREPDGMVRLGLLHYNTPEEVDRCLEAIGKLG